MQKKSTSILFVLIFLTGCTAFQKRTSEVSEQVVPGPGASYPTVQPPPSPAQPTTEPAFTRPKVGVILSAGGIKSFAHIGVLRELENNRIPIDMVAGMEWGSLVAGLYSVKGKANDAEWKLSKLSKNLMPQKEFIGRNYQPVGMKDFEPFLENVFEGKSISSGAIPFLCPARNLQRGNNVLMMNNRYVEAVMLCMPLPPATKSFQNWVAVPFDIKPITEHMKQQGIQYIILINVVPGTQRLKDESEATQILWSQVVQDMKASRDHVNYIIDVNIQDKDLMDFESRRDFINIGQEYGKIAAQRLARILGF